MTPIPACPRCGAPLAEHDRFCSRCGAALPDTPTAAREASPTESSAAEVERRLRAACGPEYQIIRELGTGGMGSVFLAREPALKRDVAVKVLAPDLAGDATARARFQREAQACASLAHPNIVAVHRVGEFGDGTPYFIMQHVAGESLAARIAREGPADLNEARRMLGQVALALAAAHAKGIIHRDIKPANVLYDAESGRVLVSDFGIAAVRRAGEVDAQAHLTGTGMAIGTPQYMSPEQLLAEAVTEKADVYSLGLLGYELIAGRGPFDITSPLEILAAVLRDTPRRLSELRPEADTELEILLAACLDRDPKARPTASEVAKRLGVDTTPLLEWPPPGLESLLGGARELRNRTALGTVPLAAAVLVMLLGADAVAGVAAAGTALASVVVIGVLLALRAIPVLWRLGLTGSAARRRGYEWNLVDEVLADSRGDTGALITGTREYAGLAPATRGQLRRWRVTRAASGVLAAVFPVVWAPFVFAAGSRGWIGSSQAFLLVLVPSTAFSAIPLSLWFREDRLLCAARARRRVGGRADAGPDRRVSWLSGFGSASRAQGPWPQRTERAALGVGAAILTSLLLVLATLSLLPLAVVGALGPLQWESPVPTLARVYSETRVARALSAYAPPTDSTISGEEARRLLLSLSQGSPSEELASVPWTPGLAARALSGSMAPLDTVMEAAVRGLAPGDLAVLRYLAQSPRLPAMLRLARAASVDMQPVASAPGSRPGNWLNVGMKFWIVEPLARVVTGAAAYDLSRRQADEAETKLRALIGLGLLAVSHGPTGADVSLGVRMVALGGRALQALYAATGQTGRLTGLLSSQLAATRGESQRLRRTLQSVGRASRSRGIVEMRSHLLLMRDSLGGIGNTNDLAFELANNAACSSFRSIVFGADAETRRVLDEARRRSSDRPSDLALYDLALRTPKLAPSELAFSPIQLTLYRIADLSSSLLQNPRVRWCSLGILLGHLPSFYPRWSLR